MRVLHLVPHLREAGNGIVNATVDLAIAQSNDGVEVTVAGVPGDMAERLRESGVVVEYLLLHGGGVLVRLRAFTRLRRLLRLHDWNVVHCHTPLSLVAVVLAAPLRRRFRIVATAHNEFDFAAVALNLADVLFVVSRQNLLSRKFYLARKQQKVRVVENGSLKLAEKKGENPLKIDHHPYILFVGGMYRRKGVDVLIRAFHIARLQESVILKLVGDGPDRPEFEALVKQIGVSGSVHFEGYRNNPSDYMRTCEVFVVPSRSEPFGLVLVEARNAGCAIVASDVGGIGEVLDGGRAGLLVPPDDPEALAQALATVLADRDLRDRMKRIAGTGLERFTAAAWSQRVAEAYEGR